MNKQHMKGIYCPGGIRPQGEADFLIYADETHNTRQADSFPVIESSRDLRRILPLVDDDPFFRRKAEEFRKFRNASSDKICLYEIESPLISLMRFLCDDPDLSKCPEYLNADPYSFLLAQDSLCVDAVNLALRVILDGKADGICFRVHNGRAVEKELYEKFIAPVELHFLEQTVRFGMHNLLRIASYAPVQNDLSFYGRYPFARISFDSKTEGTSLEKMGEVYGLKTAEIFTEM